MKYYLYESHMGGVYISPDELTYDELYCDTCGDTDQLIGCIESENDLLDAIAYLYDNYGPDYAELFVNEYYADSGIYLPSDPMPLRRHKYIFSSDCDPSKTQVECDLFGHCNTYDGYGEVRCEDYCLENYIHELRHLNSCIDMDA